ncbi:MAG: lactonase family protein [Treponema sp.]|nr:lactonase family protein [Treponema sp.]
MKYKAFIGTYSVRGSKGIYLIEADTLTGTLQILNSWPASSPAYLAVAENVLYTVLECDEFEGGGGVASYMVAGDSLSLLSLKPTGGKGPCHVCPAPEAGKLFVSNYGDGTLSVFSTEKGILGDPVLIRHEGSGPDIERQKGPHVHCSRIDPISGQLCVIDLGIDRAVFYDIKDMSEKGSFAAEAGSGPRHIVFSQKKPYAWMVCELSNEVYAFETDSKKRIGIYSALPKDYSGKSYCAAIKLSPDEKYLYVSNRGHDSIACFEINPETRALSLQTISPAGGHTPRDLAVSPDGTILLTANQDSDTICAYRLDKGLPVQTGTFLNIPSPVCVLFV